MSRSGATVKDVPAAAFIKALAQYFKEQDQFKLPDNANYIKLAYWKELAPYDNDWFFVRAASIARKIYLQGGTGVGGLAKVYGGGANRGTRKSRFQRASRGIIRKILIELDEQKLVCKRRDSSGRYITSEGRKVLDTIANQLASKFERHPVYDTKLPEVVDEKFLDDEEVAEGEGAEEDGPAADE